VSEDWKTQADRLRAEGLSIREIATRVGMSRSVVGEHFKPSLCACGNRRRHNRKQCLDCQRRARCEQHDALIQRVADLYNAGLPLREIARALGREADTDSKARAGQRVGPEVSEARARGLIGYRVAVDDKRRKAAA
jgi:transposase-like protein